MWFNSKHEKGTQLSQLRSKYFNPKGSSGSWTPQEIAALVRGLEDWGNGEHAELKCYDYVLSSKYLDEYALHSLIIAQKHDGKFMLKCKS